MRHLLPLFLPLLLAAPLRAGDPPPPAAAVDDRAALKTAALDYAEGWYTGDTARMARALHPDLAKRRLRVDPATGAASLQQMNRDQLVEATRAGRGTQTPAGQRRADVTVLDITGNAAVVKLVMRDWVDYLQLVRLDGRWVIVNVLWETT